MVKGCSRAIQEALNELAPIGSGQGLGLVAFRLSGLPDAFESG